MIIRKAKITEAKKIKEIIDLQADQGLMLSRTLDNIYANIRDFTVALVEDKVVGVCALAVFTEDFAEIRSLAVLNDYRNFKIGISLVKASLREALDYDIKNVFTLTYIPEFFKKLDFKSINKEELPHKIWRDCLTCEHFYHCDEEALIYRFEE